MAIDKLLSMLRTDDPPVMQETIQQVVKELGANDIDRVIPALADGLGDEDPEYRCTIAEVFLRLDPAASIPYVSKLLKDEDPGVQGFVCMELGARGTREAVPALIEVLQTDPVGTHRLFAARGLGYIGDPSALPALTKAMQSDDGVDHEGRPVKKVAADAIRRITEEKATASVA